MTEKLELANSIFGTPNLLVFPQVLLYLMEFYPSKDQLIQSGPQRCKFGKTKFMDPQIDNKKILIRKFRKIPGVTFYVLCLSLLYVKTAQETVQYSFFIAHFGIWKPFLNPQKRMGGVPS